MANYSELLKDPRWQRKRLKILERDNWTCQHCLSTEKTLCVHHTRYEGLPWEVGDEFLITFCNDCHDAETELLKVNVHLQGIAYHSGVPALFQLEILRRCIHNDGIEAARAVIELHAGRFGSTRIYSEGLPLVKMDSHG
jgi:hypothetical protein